MRQGRVKGREREGRRGTEGRREEKWGGGGGDSNSKTLFYKDCSLGSDKNLKLDSESER